MKFGQLIKYNARNFSLQKSSQKGDRGTSSRPIYVILKRFHKAKQVVSTLNLIYFGISQFGHAINKNFITFRILIQRYVQF